ncbi:hypothetical protein PCE1_003473 [Barthelona sp. PCE]
MPTVTPEEPAVIDPYTPESLPFEEDNSCGFFNNFKNRKRKGRLSKKAIVDHGQLNEPNTPHPEVMLNDSTRLYSDVSLVRNPPSVSFRITELIFERDGFLTDSEYCKFEFEFDENECNWGEDPRSGYAFVCYNKLYAYLAIYETGKVFILQTGNNAYNPQGINQCKYLGDYNTSYCRNIFTSSNEYQVYNCFTVFDPESFFRRGQVIVQLMRIQALEVYCFPVINSRRHSLVNFTGADWKPNLFLFERMMHYDCTPIFDIYPDLRNIQKYRVMLKSLSELEAEIIVFEQESFGVTDEQGFVHYFHVDFIAATATMQNITLTNIIPISCTNKVDKHNSMEGDFSFIGVENDQLSVFNFDDL